MGGPIATAGDLIFVAAAADNYLRAFDIETGRELWKSRLPAGGQATPMTYRAGRDQRQYLVIAAGGHAKLDTARGDFVIAFALPAQSRDMYRGCGDRRRRPVSLRPTPAREARMPWLLILSIAIQVLLIIHCIKTGRNQIWIWVLALLSFPGAIAYVAVEFIPDLFRSRTAQRTARGVKKALDPHADLRRYESEARVAGNVASRQRYRRSSHPRGTLRRGDQRTSRQSQRAV
jgi:hypothetical protein